MAPVLTGCGSSEPEDEAATAALVATETAESTEEAPEPTETAEPAKAEAGTGQDAEWANPTLILGEQISTVHAGDIQVDVYQVGTVAATRDAIFSDPDTHEPVVAAGDEIVYVNYVITNNGDPVDLGATTVNVTPKYVDWPYAGTMVRIVDFALDEQTQVDTNQTAPEAFREPGVYPLGTGETFSYGANSVYQPGTEMTIAVDYTPVDAEGSLPHDERVEGEGTGVLA